MLIYLPADVPFLLFPTFQKLWFQPSLSSSYFIRGVRLWADKKLTFSLINSPEPLTSRNQSQVLSFPSFSIIRPPILLSSRERRIGKKISIRSRIIKFYVSIKRRRWKAILIYIYRFFQPVLPKFLETEFPRDGLPHKYKSTFSN